MQDSVHLVIVLEKADAEKLCQLTGQQTPPAEYLTQMIRQMHEAQARQMHAVELEDPVQELKVLMERRTRLEEKVLTLSHQLDTLTRQYAELSSRLHALTQFLQGRGNRLSH